jgi:glycosyltransferase involved in cell wall biosynthesis
MHKQKQTLIVLSPAFTASEDESWFPAQEQFIRAINSNYPSLNVVVLTFHFPVQSAKYYSWFGNEIITFSGGLKGPKLLSLLRWRRVWKELANIRSKRNVIGIFSFFCSECAFVGHYFSKRHGIRHHIWVLGQDARKSNNQVSRIKPTPDELVCISNALIKEFEQNHGIKPAHLIPIGIDTSLYPDLPTTRDIDILGAGSLIPLKQYDVFVEVIKLISDRVGHLNAMICGDGPEKERLQTDIEAAGLQDTISLSGRQSNTALLQIMQRSKILLHPSSYEGLPAVCLEALYAGAHVISFCQPLDAGVSHWHIVTTTEEMAAKAIELLQQPDLPHTRVLPFEVKDMARRIMQLYNYSAVSSS